MFVDWNVTFKALQKRAIRANATITTILQNFGSYKSIDATRARAEEAISNVREAMNNTAEALATARDFMNGIERDFFNAFEAIKDKPQAYTFGHSNLHLEDEDKRVSEVLGLFSNFTNFFAECERTAGVRETINSTELRVMRVVDSATNLSNWKAALIDAWKLKLDRVKLWMDDMKNYTNTSSKKKCVEPQRHDTEDYREGL
ncbi:hypothetical protein ERJ75_001803400 [Trypanosoma vivax]|nr:hypothetical protein ERJ75_001803400 [Trypanosoma vivax]